MQAGSTTGGLCSGGELCIPANGCHSCRHESGFDWITIAFTSPITDPIAVTQLQTRTGGDWVKTRQRNVNAQGLQARMEEDGLDSGHNTEVFGWIALSTGAARLGGLTFEAIKTPDQVTHNHYDVVFSAVFGAVWPRSGSSGSISKSWCTLMKTRDERRA